ncbi:carboxymuconolactone decarboxylase family protein [Aminobacter anthyllidis]|uniref:carboxymuconolactone decarboxylase family protein n=1 Tax=Aminobacter anthyllidis TaxID=1035067 RepID=UPI0024582636|nr:carboxymuconolactone decarboxylase family protein [Aminobacter anthyllidis]MDH4985608.1 carboxymuconolactone decarboxylase family protein [Aminobacter anthyllidis]
MPAYDAYTFASFRRAMTVLAGAAACSATLAFMPLPAHADDYDATIQDIEKSMGGVPSFIKQFPKSGLPGAWSELKALEFSDKTALPPKTKALISLAVAAQIPCTYCIWADTENAKKLGATPEEIQEAVAMAALTRHWSTVFNGMQVDFETFKKELGGEMSAAK